ncbi:hypothetical protein PG988_014219 [Apiospora saccharicola]
MFRVTLNKAALNRFIPRPVTRITSLPPRSHLRLDRVARQANSTNTNQRSGPLMAALGATVVLALATSPVRATVPRKLDDEVEKAWGVACYSDSIAAAREAALLDTRLWLAHYFRGDFIEEGPFDQPLVVNRGLHILAEDTRVFYLPAESATTTPVVCVSINQALCRSPDQKNLRKEDIDALKNGQAHWEDLARFYPYLMMTAVTVHMDRRILPRWVREGRFKRVAVLIRWADVTSLWLYENGELSQMPWTVLAGDNDIARV